VRFLRRISYLFYYNILDLLTVTGRGMSRFLKGRHRRQSVGAKERNLRVATKSITPKGMRSPTPEALRF